MIVGIICELETINHSLCFWYMMQSFMLFLAANNLRQSLVNNTCMNIIFIFSVCWCCAVAVSGIDPDSTLRGIQMKSCSVAASHRTKRR